MPHNNVNLNLLHRYMGMNAHYLNSKWERVTFNLACAPMDERHTGENIIKKLRDELIAWDILKKAGVSLRDNAANMVSFPFTVFLGPDE